MAGDMSDINELIKQTETLEMELEACKIRNKKYLDFIKKFSNEILGED
ncbi:MAG: hypothetical protein WA120_03970 [Candidatus Hydromicrobium sp.]|nr:hypothetical protein [Candidatus Hydromicrobium sp.]